MNRYIPLLFCCFVLSGCAEQQIVDRVKLIQSIGNDPHGDAIKVSATYLAYEKKARLTLLEGDVKSFGDAFTPFALQTDHPIASGQLQTVVINEKLAKQGVSLLAGGIVRDPLISNRVTIVLTPGRASDILTASLNYPPAYLPNLIRQNMTHENTPFTNGHLFLDQYFGAGQDVFLPILVKDDKGALRMDGVGVFHGDKLALSLKNEQALFIKLLKEDNVQIHTSRYNFRNDRNKLISFKIINSTHRIAFHDDTASISMKVVIDLGDYSPDLNVALVDRDMLEVKEQIERRLTAELKAMLEEFQTNQVDPIGIGNLYRSCHRDWNEQAFYARLYPKLKLDVRTEAKIELLGVGH
ncbi:germination protein, Ger(x)C family [Paenibacillus sp. UNC496MF]|uniref:Ger(x)C family spore germination protein n=1 Tax=Paenibacillus sp. UNC496MF TaxID=1502753 RepID=UPI0008EFA26B|nr:Ger(x)C family spore germination protein [Paenibacillus sp. UNC496MF]SFI48463.1 germination protein, Ger(x)C family [Paenibacillus sp. UNC496MF]